MEARYIKSATRKEDYPKSSLPRVAFAGRSNVGKSSLINSLVGSRRLAKTSSTPGRTQTINFFQIGQEFIFVDLPGYGFARVPERIRAGWAAMIEEFLGEDKNLRLTILIVDSRHGATELDQVMGNWLAARDSRYLVVATKADKLTSYRLQANLRRIEESLECTEVVPYSAATGVGKKRLWQLIRNATSEPLHPESRAGG